MASRMNRFASWIAGAFVALVLSMGVGPADARAEALNCSVSLDYSQLSGSDFTFLEELEPKIESYMNQQQWTEDRFQRVERIDCSLQIIIQESISLTEFRARLVVATLRPIYGTTQATPVVRLNDSNWQFNYSRGTPLTRQPEQYDALTSVLDYYAYVILGYDYDTFSQRGGTPYFEEARRVAELARSQNGIGWSQISGSQSRTDLTDQLLDSRYRPLRDAYFTYHFEGLDQFASNTETARENVLNALRAIEEVYNQVSRSYVIDLFFGAKFEELAAVFQTAATSSEAYSILSNVDPSHLSEYNKLVN